MMSMWAATLLWGGLGCNGPDDDGDVTTRDTSTTTEEADSYAVTIRTTSYGVPHVLAEDWGSLGYGAGWAVARDHLCTLADQFVRANSERAKYFGPGDNDRNIDEDFGWLGLQIRAKAVANFDNLAEDQREVMTGWAKGYNRYLADTPTDEIDPRCRGEAWVQPIDEIDLFTYYMLLGQRGSGLNLVREVGNVQPPQTFARAGSSHPGPTVTPPPLEVLEPFRHLPIGSNGWAIGADRSSSGRGMLLSNTHFPSQGELQWWENHLTIPGVVNMYGASLLGSAVPNMGFNDNIAWTHTVSNTPRFIVYQLSLDPEDPTRYLYEDTYVDMTSERFDIEVLQDDGTLTTQGRTLWRTQWGPVFNAPVLGWQPTFAFTWRDANADNFNLFSAFQGMNLASDLASFEEAHRTTLGIPWVHTMMTDRDGNALYVDSATTPNLSADAEGAYLSYLQVSSAAALFADFGLIVVEANDPVFDWVEDPQAPIAGAVPYEDVPRLLRSDFVNNANMNHWMANPLEPLTGFPFLYGETGTPRLPRTKMNNRYLLEKDGASGDDYLFTLDELEAAALSARASLAEDLLDQVVARCTGAGPVTVQLDGPPQVVDITEACSVLAKWDGTSTEDAVGAHIWREFVGTELNGQVDIMDQGRMFGDAFDPQDPIYTPTTLAAPGKDGDTVLENLAAAVVRLSDAGVDLDARLGDIQYYVRGQDRFFRPGGQYLEGLIAIATYERGNSTMLPFDEAPPTVNGNTDLQQGGYQINGGNSWIMAMEFTDDGPNARAVLAYNQSENPESEHFADQSAVYAEGRLRPVVFTEADIAADPNLSVVELTETRN